MNTPDVQTDEHTPVERPGDHPGAVATPTDPTKDDGKTPEIGGPQGPEPTRYGDWERAGRCIDF